MLVNILFAFGGLAVGFVVGWLGCWTMMFWSGP